MKLVTLVSEHQRAGVTHIKGERIEMDDDEAETYYNLVGASREQQLVKQEAEKAKDKQMLSPKVALSD
jgi:hypothetical protein